MWQNIVEISLLSCTPNHIDTFITYMNEIFWQLNGFYGHPDHSKREFLRKINRTLMVPWLVVEDFNKIMHNGDKLVGRPRPMYLINIFL